MENLPKKDIFKVPEGYFETLPDKILERKQVDPKTVYLQAVKYVAAAVIVIGLIYFFTPSQNTIETFHQSNLMENEIELYIDSDYWQAEDILAFAENPDDLLDEMIAQEWSVYELPQEEIEDDLWY